MGNELASILQILLLVLKFQNLITPCPSPLASIPPFGLIFIDLIALECPYNVSISNRFLTSHILIHLFLPALARILVSGLKATVRTLQKSKLA
jgi:hypothetical protein